MKNTEQFLREKHFVYPSAQIYGGTAGLFDYGPNGIILKNEILKLWRRQFIENENIYEVETSCLLPYEVLKTSGHVDKFCDILVFDEVTGEFYRADHVIKARLENLLKGKKPAKKGNEPEKIPNEDRINEILNNIDGITAEDADLVIEEFGLKSDKGNKLGGSTRFNLIFGTHIGPKKNSVAYLRPETAQGQFLNFKKVLQVAKNLPFGTATIGKVFRNEISPRNGLIRVREFEQAEIEFFTFFDMKNNFKKFKHVERIEINVKTANDVERLISLRAAVDEKIIDSETLAYFIGKTFIFLRTVGLNMNNVRFRQHKKDEMAHYAVDCWDAEIKTINYGWVEIVGIADRSDYDLKSHGNATNTNMGILREGKSDYEIPIVIEPSFGIGRIFYAICENAFYVHNDGRQILGLDFNIAPVQIEISALISNEEFLELAEEIYFKLRNIYRVNINKKKVSIGKKYSIADEIGTPYYIVCDGVSLQDRTVTIRFRDTRKQIRCNIDNLVEYFEQIKN